MIGRSRLGCTGMPFADGSELIGNLALQDRL